MARKGTPNDGEANGKSQPQVEGSKRRRYATDDERIAAKRESSRKYYKRKNEALKAKGSSYSKERSAFNKRVAKAFDSTKKGAPKGALAKSWWNAQLAGFDYTNKKQVRDFVKTSDEVKKMRKQRGESASQLKARKAAKWAQLAKKHKLNMNRTSEFVRSMMSG